MTGRDVVKRKSTEVGLIDKMPDIAVRMVPPVGIRTTLFWLWVVGIGLFGALATWASVAQMQSAVVAAGAIRVLGDHLVVQHLEGGLVRDIAVREGEMVAEGQVLLTMDDTVAKATMDVLTNQLVSALSTQARLQAEFEGARNLTLSTELQSLLKLSPSFAAMVETQADLLLSNQRISQGQIAILQDRISQLTQQKSGIERRLIAQEKQLTITREELASRVVLLNQGFTTKSQVQAMRRDEAGLEGNLGVTQSQLDSVLEQIAEVEARKLQVRRDELRDIAEGRQQINETIFEVRQRVSAAQDVVDRLIVRAPRAGQIVGLAVNTQDSVIAAGQRLMDIVPAGAEQVVQVRVNPSDINQVAIGGAARVRLTAYNYRTTPMIEGVVSAISADSIVDPVSRLSYYEVDLRLDTEQVAKLPEVSLVPGMPAQVMIATGEQTLANYLLSPILGGFEQAALENE